MDKQEVLQEFEQRLGSFLYSDKIRRWRDDIRETYAAIAGHQWTTDDKDKRTKKRKPITTFNIMSPIIRAIAGYQVMNRSRIDFTPRHINSGKAEQIDVMGDAVESLTDQSDFYYESSCVSEDALACGLGGSMGYFDYTNPDAPHGEFREDRIFPGYLLYDNQSRKKNLKDGKWCGYAEIVGREWLTEEIKQAGGKTTIKHDTYSADFMTLFDNSVQTDDLDVLFHYEWRERETVYRVKSPFTEEMMNHAPCANAIGEWMALYSVPLEDSVYVLTRKAYTDMRLLLSQLKDLYNKDVKGEVKATQGQRWKYMKARIARGVLLDMEDSWHQGGFTIRFKTGYYDEVFNTYYGIIRAMLPVQRAFNVSVSDYLSYLDTVPKGGTDVERDAILNGDIKEFIANRANEQDVTVYESGGLQKSRPKLAPPVPQGVSEFTRFCIEIMPRVVGLSQDFLGMVESGNMTNALYGKIMRQSYMVLVHFFESDRVYLKQSGRMLMDAVRILHENAPNLIMKRLSPGKEQDRYFQLNNDYLSDIYDVDVVERPMTDEERQETFNMLTELQGQLAPMGINIMPVALQFSPLDEEQQQQAIQAMQPPPPPEPDPVQQDLLKTQAALQQSQADKNDAEAKKMMIDVRRLLDQIEQKQEAHDVDIEKTKSETVENYAQAARM